MKKKYPAMALLLALVIACAGTVFLAGRGELEDKTGWQRGIHALVNRERIQNTQYVGAVSEAVWTPETRYEEKDHAALEKTPGEAFVIMNVTDLHLSDYTQDAVTNNRNLANIRRMARNLQPDLITLSGDMFWKESTVNSVHRLTEFMDSLQIPWAPVFGNHDGEGNCDLNYLADVMSRGAYCLLQKGDAAMGVGNYIVNIRQGDRIVHSVLLMDSHNGNIWDNQLQWYRWAVEGVSEAAGEKVPSSVILHVPLAQYDYAYEEAWDGAGWKEAFHAFGQKGEECCCQRDEKGAPVDNGFFAAIRELGSTGNVLCGHDHVNTYSILWEGVRLTYGLRLGYGAYFERGIQGVTTLTIDETGETAVQHHYLYPGHRENP